MIPEVFVRRAKRLLSDNRQDLIHHLAEGRCETFEDYKHLTGQIRAYNEIEALLEEAVAESGEDNDE